MWYVCLGHFSPAHTRSTFFFKISTQRCAKEKTPTKKNCAKVGRYLRDGVRSTYLTLIGCYTRSLSTFQKASKTERQSEEGVHVSRRNARRRDVPRRSSRVETETRYGRHVKITWYVELYVCSMYVCIVCTSKYVD